MSTEEKKAELRIKNVAAAYNMLINLFWSAVNLIPVYIFCDQHLPLRLLIIFCSTGFLCLFLPNSFFNRIQIGRTRAIYKKLGVEFINKFTQNGELINNLIKKKFPSYKVVGAGKRSILKLIAQTYMFERYHFMMFLIFLLIMIFAIINGFWSWAAIILLCNIVYNVYPNLLQEYIRLRIQLIHKPDSSNS